MLVCGHKFMLVSNLLQYRPKAIVEPLINYLLDQRSERLSHSHSRPSSIIALSQSLLRTNCIVGFCNDIRLSQYSLNDCRYTSFLGSFSDQPVSSSC